MQRSVHGCKIACRAMFLTYGTFILLTIVLHLGVSSAQQIDTKECGKTTCCFQVPDGCTSAATCDVLISFKYSNATGKIDVAIGSKHAWVAFGLASAQDIMDKVTGEVCFKVSSLPALKAFVNSGYSPDFSRSMVGLSNISNFISNGAVICKYSRVATPPLGSYMQSINQPIFITVAYGNSVSGSVPQKHEINGFSNKAKIDFKKPCSVSGTAKSRNVNVTVHAALMIVAWICFAATGMFIARYMKPVAKDSTCGGEKVWFQSHRLCMTMALLLTIISFVIIFVHRKGWSETAKAHPITGCLTTLLALIQPIMAIFRPHPGEDKRWIFNWAHRLVGVSALILAVVSVLLGLQLLSVTKTVIIVWIVFVVVLILIMELALYFISKSAKAEYKPGSASASVEVEEDKTITLRKIMFLVAFLGFFALGFATVGLVAKSA